MLEEELGFDPTIVGEDRRYTNIEWNGWIKRLYLESIIKQQRLVAGRATIYWSSFTENTPN